MGIWTQFKQQFNSEFISMYACFITIHYNWVLHYYNLSKINTIQHWICCKLCLIFTIQCCVSYKLILDSIPFNFYFLPFITFSFITIIILLCITIIYEVTNHLNDNKRNIYYQLVDVWSCCSLPGNTTQIMSSKVRACKHNDWCNTNAFFLAIL